MAICLDCNQDMSDIKTVGCTTTEVKFPDGTSMPSVRYNGEGGRCHDCNVMPGQPHHPGCDMEECPKCHGQIIGCHCLYPEDDDDAAD